MQTKFEVGELVLIKNEKSFYSTPDGIPVVYQVDSVHVFRQFETEYIMSPLNSVCEAPTRRFKEQDIFPVPSNHPLFTIFGAKP